MYAPVAGKLVEEEAFTYLTLAVEILGDVAKGTLYTGTIVDDINGCRHWTQYALEKRSLV